MDEETERSHTLRFAPHTNIMTLVPFSKLHSQLKASNLQDKVDKELLKAKIIHEPILASTISKKHQGLEVSSLSELFNGSANLRGDTFRARFYVVKATSGEESIVQQKGKKSKSKGEDYFSQQFLVKDTSTSNDNNVYKVFIYQDASEDLDFYGNISTSSKDSANKIDRALETLQ